jgi:hypothetical protein
MDAFDDFRIEPYEVVEDSPFLIALVRQSGRGRASGAPIEIVGSSPISRFGLTLQIAGFFRFWNPTERQ